MPRHKHVVSQQALLILVIHDNTRTRRALARELTELHCKVHAAAGRVDGLRLMYEMRPDIIFLGITVDRKESWELFSAIRFFTETPVVLMADRPPGSVNSSCCVKNALVLIEPISTAKAVAKAKARLKFFASQCKGSSGEMQ